MASAETKERGEERRGRRGRREDSHRSIVANRKRALYLGPDSSADSAFIFSEQTVTAGDGGTWKNKNASWLAGSETHSLTTCNETKGDIKYGKKIQGDAERDPQVCQEVNPESYLSTAHNCNRMPARYFKRASATENAQVGTSSLCSDNTSRE